MVADVFFSVLTDSVHYWSRLKRTVVCLDIQNMTWICRCSCFGQKNCIHRSVAKWMFHQEHSHLMWFEKACESEDGLDECTNDETTDNECNMYMYPPSGGMLKKLLDYVYNHKRIPLQLDSKLTSSTPKLSQVMLSEVTCNFCTGVKLQGPFNINITTKGKLIGLDQ